MEKTKNNKKKIALLLENVYHPMELKSHKLDGDILINIYYYLVYKEKWLNMI